AAMSGGAYVVTYAASKAFDYVLAEGLWIELGQRGVDVLTVFAGLTDTPAMRRSGALRDNSPIPAAPPEAVVDAAFGALGTGPAVIVGDEDGAMARAFWPTPRAELIQALSAGSASLYELEVLPLPAH